MYVADRVRCIHPTRRLQHADAKSASVGPDLRVGEEFDVMWLFTANDGNEYYLTPFGTRILAEDVERINIRPAFADAV